MSNLPAEAYGEAWLSLTNEQRSELLSLRRDNQLSEKALDQAPSTEGEHEQSRRPEIT